MSELIQSVSSGTVTSSTASTSSSSSSTLDKDDFLQLLVTQMKYQDPLNPATDTEYVAQLATFSELEQMQNLNQTISNSQAYGLVGMDVEVTTQNSVGGTTTYTGTVDHVVISNGTAKISIDGSLYSLDDVTQVYYAGYLYSQGLPSIDTEVNATYDKDSPKDISFTVNTGSGDTIATAVAVIINGEVIDSSYVTLSGSKVTINKDAFSDITNGTYKTTIVFNDENYTTVSGKVNITIKGTGSSDSDDSEDTTTDDATSGDTTTDDATSGDSTTEDDTVTDDSAS